MITTADGHNIFFYLEGVRIPPLNISINVSKVATTATVSIFAHESAKFIKDGSIGAVFYSKDGLKERRLLFFGFLNTRSYSKTNGSHNVSLVFVTRMAYFSRVHAGIVGNGSYSSCSTQSTVKSDAQKAIGTFNASAVGAAIVGNPIVTKQTDANGVIVNTQGGAKTGSLKDDVTTTLTDYAVSGTDKVNVDDSSGTSITPFGKIINSVEHTYPIKSIIDKMMKEACDTSGVYNKFLHDDRFFFATYLSELPGGWGEYFFGDGVIAKESTDGRTTNKTKFLNRFSGFLENLGTTASLTDIYITLLGLLMMEAWEVPGLVDGAQIIVPESLHTDIPMCNIIWPDMAKTIKYSEDSSRRISRLVFSGGIADTTLGGKPIKPTKEQTTTSLGIYPATDVIINKPDDSIAKSYNNIIYETEIYNGSTQYYAKMPMSYLRGLNSVLLTALAKYAYTNASTSYSSCQVSMHFAPELLPGLNAVVNDGMWKGVGKIVGLRHSFSPNAPASTDVSLSNYRTLEEYEYYTPSWYSKRYDADKVDELYYTKFGVNSIGGFLKNQGVALKTLVEKLNEMYESTSVKSVMAEKLSQRFFMNQEQFFAKLGASSTQQDRQGVVIYQGDIFNPIKYEAYTVDGAATSVTADRQKYVVEYLKKIYGRPAVKV